VRPIVALAPALVGCEGVHPLSDSGSALFLVDDKPIYAADVIDDAGQPVLPRQSPYEKRVQLFLLAAAAPDRGAYVDIQMSPPDRLLLLPVDETCEKLPGAFRCTSAEDGFASFLVRSESDWSGRVELSLVGRNRGETGEVDVHPAGLPAEATDFELIVEGVAGERIPARFTSLECSLAPVPDSAFDKWPEGETRVRAAEVRAGPPPNTPGVIDHAPVIIQTFDSEVFVTLDPLCPAPRNSRLRVQLDEIGRSPSFYFCFSDLGTANARLAARSGDKSDERTVDVEVEPRLLRVVNTKDVVTVGEIDTDVAVLSAFNSDITQVSFTVDVRSSNPAVLHVSSPTAALPLAFESAFVRVTPLKAGTATIQVTPQLLASPRCDSQPITVVEP
jgi:hypothetical protein